MFEGYIFDIWIIAMWPNSYVYQQCKDWELSSKHILAFIMLHVEWLIMIKQYTGLFDNYFIQECILLSIKSFRFWSGSSLQ